MQQRKATLRRPSGTDGSDYSYRMVVDSRYQLVAEGKQRLSLLFIIQALFLLIGVIFAVLPLIKKDTPHTVAFSSVIVSFISLVIAEIGRRRSRASLLRFYAVVSSLAIVLLNVSLAKQYSLLKEYISMYIALRQHIWPYKTNYESAIRDFSLKGARKFDVDDFPGFQAGLLVYIFTLSLFNIFTIKAVISLLYNMSPPKKAS